MEGKPLPLPAAQADLLHQGQFPPGSAGEQAEADQPEAGQRDEPAAEEAVGTEFQADLGIARLDDAAQEIAVDAIDARGVAIDVHCQPG